MRAFALGIACVLAPLAVACGGTTTASSNNQGTQSTGGSQGASSSISASLATSSANGTTGYVSGSTTAYASNSASSSHDSTDAGDGDAGDGDAGDGDAGPACRSIDSVCPADGGPSSSPPLVCATTWSQAQSTSFWCASTPGYRTAIVPDCNGFNLVVVGGVDTSTFYLYDTASGALVGIEAHGGIGVACQAGVSSDVTLAGCADGGFPVIACSDAAAP